ASNVVFVTYSSSNHFQESRKGIRSLRSVFNNKIIFYDLGLQKDQIRELSNVYNLEVRKFEFEKYPSFVTNLMGYNFKPIIMAEVFSQFKNYWVIDTSVRFFNINQHLNRFYAKVGILNISLFILKKTSLKRINLISRMLDYLPIDTPLAMDTTMREANRMFLSRSELTREAVTWNALCALTKDCMAAPGTEVRCVFHDERYRTHANCHRYDQSAIKL
ncbi:hypothetical protein PENTCL1PPCAC_12787, partial [Pristionchus entomophagus]